MASADAKTAMAQSDDKTQAARVQFIRGVIKQVQRPPDEQDVRKGLSAPVHTLIWRLPSQRSVSLQVSALYNEPLRKWILVVCAARSENKTDLITEYPSIDDTSAVLEKTVRWLKTLLSTA